MFEQRDTACAAQICTMRQCGLGPPVGKPKGMQNDQRGPSPKAAKRDSLGPLSILSMYVNVCQSCQCRHAMPCHAMPLKFWFFVSKLEMVRTENHNGVEEDEHGYDNIEWKHLPKNILCFCYQHCSTICKFSSKCLERWKSHCIILRLAELPIVHCNMEPDGPLVLPASLNSSSERSPHKASPSTLSLGAVSPIGPQTFLGNWSSQLIWW